MYLYLYAYVCYGCLHAQELEVATIALTHVLFEKLVLKVQYPLVHVPVPVLALVRVASAPHMSAEPGDEGEPEAARGRVPHPLRQVQ